ncbi:unnamed protein product [Polarella glacialis]|uniref:Uncharacterized protein n=1 Tax=Polarella glacialis TaxID=89957 RepID=A0A813E6G3_POLGL|nr:unnamed protein product [Polarella glacialis]
MHMSVRHMESCISPVAKMLDLVLGRSVRHIAASSEVMHYGKAEEDQHRTQQLGSRTGQAPNTSMNTTTITTTITTTTRNAGCVCHQAWGKTHAPCVAEAKY